MYMNRCILPILKPELSYFQDDDERIYAYRIAYKTRQHSWMREGFVFCFVMCIFVPYIVIQELYFPYNRIYGRMYFLLIIMLCILAQLGSVWIYRDALKKQLRLQLNKSGTAICVHCGYLLKGLPEPRCPECGEPFDPNMHVVKGKWYVQEDD